MTWSISGGRGLEGRSLYLLFFFFGFVFFVVVPFCSVLLLFCCFFCLFVRLFLLPFGVLFPGFFDSNCEK